jgi:replicative DNA helicase
MFNPEDSVLSVLLADNSAYWDVADTLKPHDFTGLRREMFATIAAEVAAGRPVDPLTLGDLLGHEVGCDALDIAQNVVGLRSSLKTYAAQVAKRSETGRVRDAGTKIAQADSYADAQAILAAVRPSQAARVKSVEDGLTEMVEALQARFNAGDVSGVPTGIDGLDELTSGWQPGNLITLVGETSMGKSALALQCALAAAVHGLKVGKRVLYFSLEMTAGELTERAICNLADFPLRWVTHPKDAPDYAMDYVTRGSRMLKELPLLIDDQCALTLEQVTSRATQLHMQKELCLVVVDYMHIMGRPRRNDVAELGGIAAGLKNLSKTLAVPVMGLHQVNRGPTQFGRASRRIELEDIRASGEIAEASNTVLAIYRSEVARKDYAPLHGTAEVLILKQRQGRRDVRAWTKSKLGNMRLESSEAPEGYDENIEPDLDLRNGAPSRAGGNGGGTKGVPARSQSRPLSVVGSND